MTVVGDIILEKLVIHYIFLLFVCHVMCHTFCCWNSLCQCPSWKFYVVPLLRVATERYVKILFVFLLMDVNNEGSSHSYCISNILSIFKNIHWPTITYVTCWGDKIMYNFSPQNPDVYTYVLYQFWLDSVATVLRLSLVTLPLPIRQRTFIRNYVFISLVTSCFPSLATPLYLQPTSN